LYNVVVEKPLENRSAVMKIAKYVICFLAAIGMIMPAAAQLAPAPNMERVCLERQVTMISADWCVVCKRAAKFFTEKGVRYTELDYKHSEMGRFLYSNYKYKTGKEGVPVIIFMDQNLVLDGFNPKVLSKLMCLD
jgi:glutaredoxin